MAFQQLYYTSCEHGLGGYGGYQFNAITPGVSPAVLREVEESTVYEPPRWLTAAGSDEPEAYPVAFSYGTSEATGAAVTAHAVFTGADYSGRPGNYFVHALVTGAPERDFGSLLPAELWGAALWQSAPVAGTELPELPGPPPRGVIDRPGVQAFLDARGAEGVLPELLTAVGRAMAGDQPVLVVGHDATENAWWIAAVSYLMGEHLGLRMTFTTYSHRPGYSRYHFTGTLRDTLPPDVQTGFRRFDFTAGRTPGGEVHPLAAMLASTGVMATAGLWQQAAAFAAGTEKGLDDWFAPVAVAAGLLGRRLSPVEADAVARWLPGAADWISPQLADVALGVALAEPDGTLADDRLIDLLGLARRLAALSRAEHLERLLVDRAITHIRHGQPATPVRLASPAAQTAGEAAIEILHSAGVRTVLAALSWAAASRVMPPDTELQEYGRTRLDPATPERQLAALVSRYPAILRGLLERLAGEPAEVVQAVLAGPIAARLKRDDLAGFPELAELWLVQSVAAGRIKPLRAFDEIRDIRAGAQRSPLTDASVLRLLWPGGCPPDQLAELLGVLDDVPPEDILDWLAGQVSAVRTRGTTAEGWLGLVRALDDHAALAVLPGPDATAVRETLGVLPLLQRAQLDGPDGDTDVFAELFGAYPAAGADTRRLLERELPALLARARPLGRALRGCPDDLVAAFCRELQDRLAPTRADINLARRVFIVIGLPDAAAQPLLGEGLMTAFEQVRLWSRHDLGTLAESMDKDAELAQSFRRWRKARRGEWARRLLGGTGPSAQGT